MISGVVNTMAAGDEVSQGISSNDIDPVFHAEYSGFSTRMVMKDRENQAAGVAD